MARFCPDSATKPHAHEEHFPQLFLFVCAGLEQSSAAHGRRQVSDLRFFKSIFHCAGSSDHSNWPRHLWVCECAASAPWPFSQLFKADMCIIRGRLTDGQGRVVDFKNTVVILTSNVGAEALLHGQRGGAIPKEVRCIMLRNSIKSTLQSSAYFATFLYPHSRVVCSHRFLSLSFVSRYPRAVSSCMR